MRSSHAARYEAVRSHTERLAAPLSPEDQTAQSMPDVSPAKWHRAHTTWFFETFLLADEAPYDPEFRFLFNSYYEGVGPRHARHQRGLVTRPGAAEVGAYRRQVDERMQRLLDGEVGGRLRDLVELGLHHEQQHQELLLMDIQHVLWCNPTAPVYAPDAPDVVPCAEPRSWVGSEGGIVEVGHPGAGFAFDNEGPRHAVLLQPFELATTLVTNCEWLAFVDDGGYQRPELWLSDGWATVCAERWAAPLFWRSEDGEWSRFCLRGELRLDPSAPVVHLSYYEADAFARWAGARLPLEAEWEVTAALGALHDAFGQAWQWTASAYLPYPGFRPAAGAVGEYNGKFMVNQHVLRGSSCFTPPGHERLTYRNFFPPGARWVGAGVRLARDLD